MKGLANVKVLIGVVNILGSNIGPEHEAVQIFSPSSSSLISLCEFSDAKIKLETKKRTLRDTLQKQSSDLIQKAVKRAKKAATVLLISSLQTVETSFVSSFQCYEGIFNLDLDKVDAFAITLQITQCIVTMFLISFSIHQKFVLIGLFVSICLQFDMLIYSTCLCLSILLFQSKYLFFIHLSVHPHIFLLIYLPTQFYFMP